MIQMQADDFGRRTWDFSGKMRLVPFAVKTWFVISPNPLEVDIKRAKELKTG